MIQIATGDGWYSLVAREIRNADGTINKPASFFFASYMLVVGEQGAVNNRYYGLKYLLLLRVLHARCW